MYRQAVEWRSFEGEILTPSDIDAYAFLEFRISNPANRLSVTTLALVDTGNATFELSGGIRQALGLAQNGQMRVHGNTGTEMVPLYGCTVQLVRIPDVIIEIQATESRNDLPSRDTQALVGMGFLNWGALVLQGRDRPGYFEYRTDLLQPI